MGAFASRATSRSIGILLIASVLVFVPSGNLQADVVTFLNFTDIDDRLNELAGVANVDEFSNTEVDLIKSNITNHMQAMFEGYTVAFADTAPASGSYERLNFGATTTVDNLLGRANRLDYRNQTKNDSASIYTKNFAFTIETSDSRARQITELSLALAGTAAHELGHNIGLQHHDAYGTIDFVASNVTGGGPIDGRQNTSIMATSSTGLREAGRESLRSFSDISHAKLEYSDGLVETVLSSLNEQAGAHGSIESAQAIALQDFVLKKTRYDDGANIIGVLATQGEEDFFSFDMVAGDVIAFALMSDTNSNIASTLEVDGVLELFGAQGQLIASNNDVNYKIDSINEAAEDSNAFRTEDSLLLNYRADQTGTYYLKLSASSSSDVGQYEIFVARDRVAAVPEVAQFGFLFAVGVAFLLFRWSKQRKPAGVESGPSSQ